MPKVKFKARTTAEIEDLDIENGSLIYNTENGKTYLDYNNNRIPTGSGSGGGGIPVSDTPPENPEENDLWVDTNDEEHLAEVDDEISTTSTNAVQNQAITNYVNGLNIYSTSETDTGKTWINGEHIYRRVIIYTWNTTLGNSSTTTNIEIAHNISNFNFVTFWSANIGTDSQRYTLPAFGDGKLSGIILIDSSKLNFRIVKDTWGPNTMTIVLEYTKTTD